MRKAIQKEFRGEKVVKRKGDKLYVKWKGNNSSFNSWIDKRNNINEWTFSKTEIFLRKGKIWIRFLKLSEKKADLENTTEVDASKFSKR